MVLLVETVNSDIGNVVLHMATVVATTVVAVTVVPNVTDGVATRVVEMTRLSQN